MSKTNQFAVKKPCSQCPFAKSEGGDLMRESLGFERVNEIAQSLLNGTSGAFPCHKTTHSRDENYNENGEFIPRNVSQCAGAMAFALKNDHMPAIMRAGIAFRSISADHYDEAMELTIDNEDLDEFQERDSEEN